MNLSNTDLSDKEKVNFGKINTDIVITFIQKLIILTEKIFLDILWLNIIVWVIIGDGHVHTLEPFCFYGWIWIFFTFTNNLTYVHIGIYLSFTHLKLMET